MENDINTVFSFNGLDSIIMHNHKNLLRCISCFQGYHTSTDWVLTELSFHSFWPSSSKAVKTPTCWQQQENIYGRRTMASHLPLMRTIHSDFFCLSHLHLFTVCIKPLSSAAYQKMLFCCTQAWWCSLIKTATEQRHGGPVQYPLQNWFCVSAYAK